MDSHVVDFLPWAKALVPQLFSSNAAAVDPEKLFLIRMTLNHSLVVDSNKFEDHPSSKHAKSLKSVTDFETSRCSLITVHVAQRYDTMEIELPADQCANFSEPTTVSLRDLNIHHSVVLPKFDIASRGDSSMTLLVNAIRDKAPWTHLPYQTHLVEYIVLVSTLDYCCSRYSSDYYRSSHTASLVRRSVERQSAAKDTVFVMHAWLSARVISPFDPRAMWSMHRCFGHILVCLQTYSIRQSTVMSIDEAKAKHHLAFEKIAKRFASQMLPGETTQMLSTRILWSLELQHYLHAQIGNNLEDAIGTIYNIASRGIYAPCGWGMLQLQLEITPDLARHGWRFGALVMGLGCSNMRATPILHTNSRYNISPPATIQWGNALSSYEQREAVISVLCDCPELLYQRSTGVMLLHWLWIQSWATPCSTSSIEEPSHNTMLRLLNDALHAVNDTNSCYTLEQANLRHHPQWPLLLDQFFGDHIVENSDLRVQLRAALHAFRLSCEQQWKHLAKHNILQLYESHLFDASNQTNESSSEYQPKRTRITNDDSESDSASDDALGSSTDAMEKEEFLTQPLSLNMHTSYHWKKNCMRNIGYVLGSCDWKPWLAAGDCEKLPTYLYSTLKENTCDPNLVQLLNETPMSPLLSVRWAPILSYNCHALRDCPHTSTIACDFQRFLQLWYCAKIMVAHVALPLHVHHGANFGHVFWSRVGHLLNVNTKDNQKSIAVVPSADLVYNTRTEVWPQSVTSVGNLQQFLSQKTDGQRALTIVVLYAHWWTLDHWHKLMQAIEYTCNSKLNMSCVPTADSATHKTRVTMHVVGTMWLHCMQKRAHQAVWPQLFHSKFTVRHQLNPTSTIDTSVFSSTSNNSASISVGMKHHNSKDRKNQLIRTFLALYPTCDARDQWTMPLKGVALQTLWDSVMRAHRLDKTRCSFSIHHTAKNSKTTSSTAKVHHSRVDEYFQQDSIAIPSSTTEDNNNKSSEEESDGEQVQLNQLENEAFGTLLSMNVTNQTTNTNAFVDTSLTPETLILFSIPSSSYMNYTMESVYNAYPDQQSLQQSMEEINLHKTRPLQLRVWLRQLEAHVVLTHFKYMTPEEMRYANRVCWCHTPYEGHFACGVFYLQPSLALHQTPTVVTARETLVQSGTNAMYCHTLPLSYNGAPRTTLEPLTCFNSTCTVPMAWMRLADPLPLFDRYSLANYKLILNSNRNSLYEQPRTCMTSALLFPTAQDYTSVAAQHVVLYMTDDSSMQAVWCALQLACKSITFVGVNFYCRPQPVLDCIRYCRPLQPPIDGLWLDYVLVHATQMHAWSDVRFRTRISALKPVVATPIDAHQQVTKRTRAEQQQSMEVS